MKFLNKNKLIVIFCIINIIGLLSFLLYSIYVGNAFQWLVMENNPENFQTDYFRHIAYAANLNTLYTTTDACFPPLAYIIYRFLYLINPVFDGDVSVIWEYVHIYRTTEYNLLISFGTIILQVIFFYKIIDAYLKNNKLVWLIVICLIFSFPFFSGVIERNNMSFFVLILLLTALYFKDSKNKFLQEFSLILFALSASLKLYPLAFCVLYLYEKRFSQFIRLLLYFALGIFIPFLFLGDIKVLFPRFLNVLLEVNNFNSTNIRDLPSLFRLLNYKTFHIGNNYESYIIIGIQFLYGLFVLIRSYKTEYNWKKVLYISSLMIIFLNKGYRYTLIYAVLPLVLFFNDNKVNKNDICSFVTVILFACIFTIPSIIISNVEIVPYMSFYVLIIYETITDIVISKKKKKNKVLVNL